MSDCICMHAYMYAHTHVYTYRKLEFNSCCYFCSFMSTLLTTVLTHHCAWIYTVSNDAPDRQEENKHKPKAVSVPVSLTNAPSSGLFNSLQLNLLSKTHPYNSLWAQLG